MICYLPATPAQALFQHVLLFGMFTETFCKPFCHVLQNLGASQKLCASHSGMSCRNFVQAILACFTEARCKPCLAMCYCKPCCSHVLQHCLLMRLAGHTPRHWPVSSRPCDCRTSRPLSTASLGRRSTSFHVMHRCHAQVPFSCEVWASWYACLFFMLFVAHGQHVVMLHTKNQHSKHLYLIRKPWHALWKRS